MTTKDILREVCGILMTLSFMSCFLPQIIKIIKTKSSSDLSPLMIILSMSGYIFGLLYMYHNVFGLWWVMNYVTGIITSGVLLYFWYRNKDNGRKD